MEKGARGEADEKKVVVWEDIEKRERKETKNMCFYPKNKKSDPTPDRW